MGHVGTVKVRVRYPTRVKTIETAIAKITYVGRAVFPFETVEQRNNINHNP